MSRSRFASLLLSALLASNAAAQVGPPVTPGFPNQPQVAGSLLSGLNAPEQGRTAILAYHGGVLFTIPEVPSSQPGADFLVRTWDISDPTDPQITATLERTPMPVNAHGYMKSGEYLVVGPNWPPETPWSWRYAGPGNLVRTEYPDLLAIGVRGMLFPPWFVGDTWWTYGDVEGNAFIERNWNRLSEWDHLGMTGVIGHPFLIGDLLIFASDQSRTGIATYDVSDPRNPVLLDVLTTGGAGGYWPEIWGGDGRLLVVWPYRTNGNGIRVVDATDPADLQFIADTPLPGDAAMYMQFQDEYAFTGDHKVDMRTFQSVLHLDAANATRTDDGGTGIDTSQFALPIGNLLVTGGIGPNEGMAIWAHQDEPDTRGPSVGYHRPLAGQTNVSLEMPISLLIHETLETFTIVNGETFIVRPLGGDPIDGQLHFAFDDVLTFQPDADLLPDATYEVVLPEGGIKDAAGNGIVGYSFTFSTGGSVGGNQPPSVELLSADTYPAAPAASIGFSATASDPDVDPLEYRFDFGDGSPRTAWGSASSASHAYSEVGHYQASVQVRDPSGSIASGATTVTVAVGPPPEWRRPQRSTPIVVDRDARRVWIVNPDNDSLSAMDADSLELLFEVPTCDDPRSVALDLARSEIWVACHDDDRVRVHAASDGAAVEDIETGYGSAPIALVIEDSGDDAHLVLQGNGELVRFDVPSRGETGRLALGPRARGLALTHDRRLLVTRFLSEKDHSTVWEVDAASYTLARTNRMLKFGGDANRDTTATGKGVANMLTSIAASWDGTRAWFTGNKPNSERGPLTGPDLDQDNSVRNMIGGLDLAGGGLTGHVDLDNSDSASAVAYTPLGDFLFVALQGNDEVMVLDALRLDSASGLGAIVTRLNVGGAPQGIDFDPVTNRTWVKNFTDRTVTVLETDELFRTGARAVDSTEISTTLSESLEPEVLLGKQIFYDAGERMSAEGYISCASCHVDGGHDGRTWDFTGRGEGLRNTTSLRGRGGVAHGNVHWSANFDEIQDFENDIRGAFGGTGFLSEADWLATQDTLGAPKAGRSPELDALAAYVASLQAGSIPRSPFRGSDGFLTAEARAGRDVFAAEACATCHAGEELTDSTLGSPTLHDVGTIRTTSGGRLGGSLPGLDTPTLLGVWNTAPYFHDGSAPDLASVFRIAGGTLLPAESGALSSGASLTDMWVDLNNDSTPRGEAYVSLNDGRLTFTNVDGGSGGIGAVEVRYSNGWPSSLDLIVNGNLVSSQALPPTDNEPQWRQTVWEIARIEGVDLMPGATNTVELVGGPAVDDILLSTADDLANAEPHRRVLALPQVDRDALIAYLLQLDGRPEDLVAEPPGQVDLRVDATTVSWTAVTNAEGYDVVRGSLDLLRGSGGDFAAATEGCVADDLVGTSTPHDAVPAGQWFLVRAWSAAGSGPWDSDGSSQGGSRDAGVDASPSACP